MNKTKPKANCCELAKAGNSAYKCEMLSSAWQPQASSSIESYLYHCRMARQFSNSNLHYTWARFSIVKSLILSILLYLNLQIFVSDWFCFEKRNVLTYYLFCFLCNCLFQVILDEAIVKLSPDFFWLGGGEVYLKLGIRTSEFIQFVKPFIFSCSTTWLRKIPQTGIYSVRLWHYYGLIQIFCLISGDLLHRNYFTSS